MARHYDLHRAKILVADDVAINRAILDRLISEHNGIPVPARNGREAVDLFILSEHGGFALILMDITMPEMDGIAAAAAVRSADRPDAKTIPIIAVTAEPAAEVQDKCERCGMKLFMQKPFDADKLLQAIAARINYFILENPLHD